MFTDVPYIDRIIALLGSDAVSIKIVTKSKLKKHEWGKVHLIKKRIRIWRKLQFEAQVFVLVHECLHLLKPEKSEEWVRSRTYQVWGFISTEERQKLEGFLRRHT